MSLGLEVEGRNDIIIDLTSPGSLESLNKHPFTIKEGATFRMKAKFKVQHQILSGLKYVQVVSRMGLKNKMQEMIVCGLSALAAFLTLLTALVRARTRQTRLISRHTRRSVSQVSTSRVHI